MASQCFGCSSVRQSTCVFRIVVSLQQPGLRNSGSSRLKEACIKNGSVQSRIHVLTEDIDLPKTPRPDRAPHVDLPRVLQLSLVLFLMCQPSNKPLAAGQWNRSLVSKQHPRPLPSTMALCKC